MPAEPSVRGAAPAPHLLSPLPLQQHLGGLRHTASLWTAAKGLKALQRGGSSSGSGLSRQALQVENKRPRLGAARPGPAGGGRGPRPGLGTHLQLAPSVRAALIVQAVGPLVLRTRRLPLLQRRAPAPAAGLLPLGPAGEGTGWGSLQELTAPGRGHPAAEAVEDGRGVVCAVRQQGRRPHRAHEPQRARGAPVGTETSHARDTSLVQPSARRPGAPPGPDTGLCAPQPGQCQRPDPLLLETSCHRNIRQGTLALEVPAPLGLTPGQGLPSGEELGWGFQYQMPYQCWVLFLVSVSRRAWGGGRAVGSEG